MRPGLWRLSASKALLILRKRSRVRGSTRSRKALFFDRPTPCSRRSVSQPVRTTRSAPPSTSAAGHDIKVDVAVADMAIGDWLALGGRDSKLGQRSIEEGRNRGDGHGHICSIISAPRL